MARQIRRSYTASWLALGCGLLIGSAQCATLSDCGDAKTGGPESSNPRRIRELSSRTPHYFLTLASQTKNGAAVAYSKGDVVVEGPLGLLESEDALVASKTVRLGLRWLFSPNFTFTPDQPAVLKRQAVLRGGTTFGVFTGAGRTIYDRLIGADVSYPLVDPKGQICDRLFVRHPSGDFVYLPGVLPAKAEDARFDRRVLDVDFGRCGLRIVFNRRSGGMLSFQEHVWGFAGYLARTAEREFDPGAKTIEISGLTFEVSEVTDTTVTLRYDIPERLEIPRAKAYASREFVVGAVRASAGRRQFDEHADEACLGPRKSAEPTLPTCYSRAA